MATSPESRGSQAALFWLSGAVGTCMVGFGIIWPLIPVYAAQLGAGGIEIGLIIAAFNISQSLTNPLVGRFSDSCNRKLLIISGLLLCSAVSLCYPLVSTVQQLFVLRLLHGAAAALVLPVSLSAAADLASDRQLGEYIGTLNMAVMFGMGTGPVIGGIVNDACGLNATFWTMSFLALVAFFGALFSLPDFVAASSADPLVTEGKYRSLLHHRPMQGLFLLRFFGSMGQGAVYTFLPVLATFMHLSSSRTGIVLSVNIYLIALLQRWFGKLADSGNPVPMMVLSAGCSGIFVALMPVSASFTAILLINIAMALCNAFALSSGYVVAGQVGRQYGMGSVMATIDTGRSLGFMVSPIAAGLILDSLGPGWIFYLGGMLIVTASAGANVLLRAGNASR